MTENSDKDISIDDKNSHPLEGIRGVLQCTRANKDTATEKQILLLKDIFLWANVNHNPKLKQILLPLKKMIEKMDDKNCVALREQFHKDYPDYGKTARDLKLSTYCTGLFRTVYEAATREEYDKPPPCLLCMEYTDKMGELVWIPEMPAFFAVHDFCMMAVPEMIMNRKMGFARVLYGMSIEVLSKVLQKRSNSLCCVSDCMLPRALIPCFAKNCLRKFHLPCMLYYGGYVDYKSFRSFCPPCFEDQRVELTMNVVKELEDYKQKLIAGGKRQAEEPEVDKTCSYCQSEVPETNVVLNKVVMSVCCKQHFYHFKCAQTASMRCCMDFRCPWCNVPSLDNFFEEQLWIQGVMASRFLSGGEVDNSDEIIACYYSHNNKCYCPKGNLHYDPNVESSSDANNWEGLNTCDTCGAQSHRFCAGPPWSNFVEMDSLIPDYDEPPWVCQDCRKTKDEIIMPEGTEERFEKMLAEHEAEVAKIVEKRQDESLLDSIIDESTENGERLPNDTVEKRALNGDIDERVIQIPLAKLQIGETEKMEESQPADVQDENMVVEEPPKRGRGRPSLKGHEVIPNKKQALMTETKESTAKSGTSNKIDDKVKQPDGVNRGRTLRPTVRDFRGRNRRTMAPTKSTDPRPTSSAQKPSRSLDREDAKDANRYPKRSLARK